ncbi:hypothetical protein Cus16_2811 [Curtobacterium sp. ER1/6]|nr:hypothetical protein Cus16_2811 [Curtobacterium sp. ER1/6]
MVRSAPPGVGPAASYGVPRVRRLRRRRCPRRVRCGGTHRQGGGATVIVVTIAAAVLGIASVVYLVWALVHPERF